jgi:DNA-directed RNA polymerase subunit M/transcription elongation factor TFIIS
MFNLSWNGFESSTSCTFKDLLLDEDFNDVTLVCDDDKQIKAHKVILSSASDLLKRILKNNPHQHPLTYLNGIRYEELQSLIKFISLGQVEVKQDSLEIFMKAGKLFEINGLLQNNPINEHIDKSLVVNKDMVNLHLKIEEDHEEIVNKEHAEDYSGLNTKGIYVDEDNLQIDEAVDVQEENISRKGKLSCDQCEYQANMRHHLKIHTMAKHEGVKYECKECTRTFSHKSALIRHRKSAHTFV